MRRVEYALCDEHARVVARIWAPEGVEPEVEPWMLHNITTRGWRLDAIATTSTGVVTHGHADWAGVADSLAEVVRVVLSYSERISAGDPPTEQDADDLLGRAQAALDDYDLARLEASLGQTSPDHPDGEAPDGQAGD